jgi:hypothetical protein
MYLFRMVNKVVLFFILFTFLVNKIHAETYSNDDQVTVAYNNAVLPRSSFFSKKNWKTFVIMMKAREAKIMLCLMSYYYGVLLLLRVVPFVLCKKEACSFDDYDRLCRAKKYVNIVSMNRCEYTLTLAVLSSFAGMISSFVFSVAWLVIGFVDDLRKDEAFIVLMIASGFFSCFLFIWFEY